MKPGEAQFTDAALATFRAQFLVFPEVVNRAGSRADVLVWEVRRRVLPAIAGPDIDGCATYVFEQAVVEAWLARLHDHRS